MQMSQLLYLQNAPVGQMLGDALLKWEKCFQSYALMKWPNSDIKKTGNNGAIFSTSEMLLGFQIRVGKQ